MDTTTPETSKPQTEGFISDIQTRRARPRKHVEDGAGHPQLQRGSRDKTILAAEEEHADDLVSLLDGLK